MEHEYIPAVIYFIILSLFPHYIQRGWDTLCFWWMDVNLKLLKIANNERNKK